MEMGLTQELSDKLNEIKIKVLRKFKHERYLQLNEEKGRVRDKRTLLAISAEIRALK